MADGYRESAWNIASFIASFAALQWLPKGHDPRDIHPGYARDVRPKTLSEDWDEFSKTISKMKGAKHGTRPRDKGGKSIR